MLVGLFLVLGLPWIRHAWTALPADDAIDDAWLVFWVLDWVRHALATAPTTLFDPPVNWPAPHQLAGSEHFLASQILYAPLRWLTASPLAAANLTALCSYALAAAAMDALLVGLGIAPSAAVVLAIAYGFGWHGTPGRMHILQSQHVWLPLAALALHRLRARPTAARAGITAAVLAAGLLSSYHMAVYLAVGASVWGAFELARTTPARGRYAVLAGVAGAVAVGVLVAVSLPYLTRPEARGDVDLVFSRWKTSHLGGGDAEFVDADLLLVARSYLGCALGGGTRLACVPIDWLAERSWTLVGAGALPPFALVLPLLLLAGLLGTLRGGERVRRVVVLGAALVVAGLLLWGPEAVHVGGVRIPFPRTFVAASPARFIRVPQRALVLSFFGATLIAACGLELALGRLPARLRPLAAGALALAVVVRVPPPGGDAATVWERLARWSRLAPVRWLDNPAIDDDAASYAALAERVRADGGPLLDLPASDDGTAVVGQMIHRQPSLCFYTGYLPAHVSMVEALIAALPDEDALDDLVDMTGLRWIVLRPPGEWTTLEARERMERILAQSARVRSTTTVGAFTLVGLDPRSERPEWRRALSGPPRHGVSALGTPLEPLRLVADGAGITLRVPAHARAGQPLPVWTTVENRTAHGWPTPAPARPDQSLAVRLELRWITAAGDARVEAHPFRRDVPGNTAITQTTPAAAPAQAGRYGLVAAVRQVDGPELVASSPSEVIVDP